MSIPPNDPNLKTWLPVLANSDFPIQNIPFGVFSTPDDIVSVGTRIGDYAVDLAVIQQLGYFDGISLPNEIFEKGTLNDFISEGITMWRRVRQRVSNLFEIGNKELQFNQDHRDAIIFKIEEVEMQLPVHIGDYTDFYSSKEHATNVGSMFRDPENALPPNWLHIPIGYHGRSSTIVPSGEPIHRPKGQMLINKDSTPVFGPSQQVDFELEMAFITADANAMGQTIPVNEAENFIFGMVLLNDWSARDFQKWEYKPLGPFQSKSFASSISPWIITMDALEPFRVMGPQQNPVPLPYLRQEGKHSFDIHLEADITPNLGEPKTVSKTNHKYLYWTMAQQLAHHSVNGCKINSGDLMGSGTISGPTPDSYGSMLELSRQGTRPVELQNGLKRTFIEDNDTVTLRGYCENDRIRIGFGEVVTRLLPVL